MKQTLKYSVVIMVYLLLYSFVFIDICTAEENIGDEGVNEQVYFEKMEGSDIEEIDVKTTDIEIEGYQEELLLGDTMNLTATVVPSNATETMVTYKSSDNSP